MSAIKLAVGLPLALFLAVPAQARQWSDVSGQFKLDAEFFAVSDDTVVLKKRNGSLVGMEIAELSSDDQRYIEEKKETLKADAASASASVDEFQTWTSVDGFELRGRIIAFDRQPVVIKRVAGVATVNGIAFSRLNLAQQHIVLKIVAHFDDPSVKTAEDLDRWLKGQDGDPPVFTIEGVQMKLEDGSELAVPFILFSEQDLSILRPGWEQWKAEQASEADRSREDFLLSVQADNYQKQRAADARAHQVQMMQLEMLAVNAGLISIWEVSLRPNPLAYGRALSVIVPANNSLQAQELALQRYPGYVVAGVRRASF